MSERFILNETSYFGRGSRVELANEINTRGFKKVLVVTDKALIDCGVTGKVTEILDNAKIEYKVYSEVKPQNQVSLLSLVVPVFAAISTSSKPNS